MRERIFLGIGDYVYESYDDRCNSRRFCDNSEPHFSSTLCISSLGASESNHTSYEVKDWDCLRVNSDLEVIDTVMMCFQSDFDDPMISKGEHGYHSSFERWIHDIQYYFAFIFHAQDYFLCVSVFI